MKRIVPILLLLSACGPSALQIAEEADTIAAWETFLRENPEHKHAFIAYAGRMFAPFELPIIEFVAFLRASVVL